MKINEKFEGDNPIVFTRQILRIMKLTIVIMTAFLLQVSALTKAQITLNIQSEPMQKVLKNISKQSGYDFVYSTADLKQLNATNINLTNASIETALKACFADLPLQYEIADRTVMIKRKDEPSFIAKLIDRFQSIEVNGRVVDVEGKALPGATVKVKTTGKGVSADVKGNFHLQNVEEGAVLVVSYTGYISKEVKAEKEMGNVVLELSLSKLDEVQVIAYGTTTQRLSTGNVTTIKADVIEKQPVNNPLLALQGRVPGLFIEQATGFAGTGVKVRIQGRNSIDNGTDPFYVIDGVPYPSQLQPGGNLILGTSGGSGNLASAVGNPLSFINPADIESIDVLKDADATAIYGSRAANGAILITTKKGKTGDTKINLSLQSGLSKVPKKLDLMNTEQYLEMRSEAVKNDGLNPAPGLYGDYDLSGYWNSGKFTDWQKLLLGKNGRYDDINASISGGNVNTTFLISTGYHKETTVFPGDFANQKGSVRFNIGNSSINNKLKLQLSGSYLFDNNELPNSDLTELAMTLAPVYPSLYREDGSLNWEPDIDGHSTIFTNAVAYLYNRFLNKTNNLLTTMVLSYQILPGLDLRANFGYNKFISNTTNKTLPQSFPPEYSQYIPRSTAFGNNNSNFWSIEPQVTYSRSLYKGKLEILLGTTIQQNRNSGFLINASGFVNDLVMDDIMSAAKISPLSSNESVYKYNALFGRINYNFRDKYIVNITARRDGSSRFGPKSQFHNFASTGLAWIFSNEDLIKNRLNFLSFGKFRASYGTTGNDQIGDYNTLSLYTPLPQQVPFQGMPVYKPQALTNPYLQWEETRKMQFGLDLGFFKDKFILNVNHYINHSSNLLGNYQLPITTGFLGVTRNQNYIIKNAGWEVMLSTKNLHQRYFNWSSSINLTAPKTLLVDYPGIEKSSEASKAMIGRPLSISRFYHFLGVDPATGVYLFQSKNGNPTSSPKEEDKTVIMDLAPQFYMSLQNNFTYKGFQLDFSFSYVNQVGRNYAFGSSGFSAGNFNGGTLNQPVSLLSRWQKPGDIASIQKYTTGYDLLQPLYNVYLSDAAWKDASYLRLKNISFSWQLPESWLARMHLRTTSLFLQAQNFWTLTSYNGLDPETKSSTTLPPLKTITMGVRMGI